MDSGEIDKKTVICRKATVDDVDSLVELINDYAQQGIMLPRSKAAIERLYDTFVVAEIGDKVVGCGSLFQLGTDLVEIRSLGMTDGYKGLGIGGKIVDFLTVEARNMGMKKMMALTYAVSFFEKHGFSVVQKEIFPEKVWTDCVNCAKQHACDEIAVLKMLN